jgi:hypothetical protein
MASPLAGTACKARSLQKQPQQQRARSLQQHLLPRRQHLAAFPLLLLLVQLRILRLLLQQSTARQRRQR